MRAARSPFVQPAARRFTVVVESRVQAHALQNFLWCLWFAALNAHIRAGTYAYVYNGVGEQTEQRDSRSPTQFITRTQYDSFGRKTGRTETHPLGTGLADTVWSYDCANGKGLLCSVGYSAPAGSGASALTT